MAANAYRHTIERLWSRFDAGKVEVGELLHDDFDCEWPQSSEVLRGRDNFITLNTDYPRRVRIQLQLVFVAGNTVITETLAPDAANPTQVDRAVSFFEFRDGKIVYHREFPPDPFVAAAWCAQWVERPG